MTALILNSAQRREHRAAAHHLQPLVRIGAEGLTAAVSKEVDAALKAHGLIKVRAFVDDREARATMFATLAEQLGAAPVQHLGKLFVLWRPRPDKEAPKEKAEREGRMPGPRVVKLVSFSKSGNHRATVKKVKVFGNERVTPGGQIKRAKVRQISAKKRAGA